MPRPSPVRALAASLLLLTACGSSPTASPSVGSGAPTAPNSLTLSGVNLPVQLSPKQTLQLAVSVNGHAAQSGELVWTSSNAGVASVSASGLLTASAEGNVTIHVALAAAPASGMDIPASVTASASGTSPATPLAYAQRLLDLTNAARAQARTCGSASYAAASPLTLHALLVQTAQGHAADMAARNYFAHDTPEGLTPQQRLTNAGYAWRAAGENIAAGQATPEAVIAGWLGSAGHCANLMNPSFRDVGLGYAEGGSYGRYWVMDLGAR